MCSQEDHMHTDSIQKPAFVQVWYASSVHQKIMNKLYMKTVLCLAKKPVKP
jgi:hypothetical protein